MKSHVDIQSRSFANIERSFMVCLESGPFFSSRGSPVGAIGHGGRTGGNQHDDHSGATDRFLVLMLWFRWILGPKTSSPRLRDRMQEP